MDKGAEEVSRIGEDILDYLSEAAVLIDHQQSETCGGHHLTVTVYCEPVSNEDHIRTAECSHDKTVTAFSVLLVAEEHIHTTYSGASSFTRHTSTEKI